MIIHEDVLREFQNQKVKYVIAGGIAVNMLGSMRSTADLDILVEMTDENLAKIIAILKKNGYKIKQPVDPMKIADEDTRKDWIKNKHLKANNFYKDDGAKEIDILIDTPISYEEAVKNAEQINTGDIVLPIISIDDLIKMKHGTGRGLDEIDIKELNMIKELRKKR